MSEMPIVFSCNVNSITERFLVDDEDSRLVEKSDGWAFLARDSEDLVSIPSALLKLLYKGTFSKDKKETPTEVGFEQGVYLLNCMSVGEDDKATRLTPSKRVSVFQFRVVFRRNISCVPKPRFSGVKRMARFESHIVGEVNALALSEGCLVRLKCVWLLNIWLREGKDIFEAYAFDLAMSCVQASLLLMVDRDTSQKLGP
jgi:hypothetical protein